MQREFTKWNEIYKQATIDLKKEQMWVKQLIDELLMNQKFIRETASAIEPLKYQLNQLDRLIKDHHQSIDQLRGNLVMNEQKIGKIFTDV